jgi:hypothetical protein
MSFALKELSNNRLKIEKHCPVVSYEYVGGKINSKTLHKIIKNGYADDPKKTDSLDGYVLDKQLSGERAQVYYHPETKHLVVNHRGTKGVHDVMTDIGLMLGHKSGKRFQHGKKITDDALKKYNTDNVTISGHSLGAKVAKESNRKHGKETVVVNPAVVPEDLFEKQKDNETVIRSRLDPISYLHNFNPRRNKTKTIDIDAKTYNPLEEHSSDVLTRLGGVDGLNVGV